MHIFLSLFYTSSSKLTIHYLFQFILQEEEKALFVDFVTKMLTIDPDKRPTADEALAHPWILSGYNLSEEDLKYPPEESKF